MNNDAAPLPMQDLQAGGLNLQAGANSEHADFRLQRIGELQQAAAGAASLISTCCELSLSATVDLMDTSCEVSPSETGDLRAAVRPGGLQIAKGAAPRAAKRRDVKFFSVDFFGRRRGRSGDVRFVHRRDEERHTRYGRGETKRAPSVGWSRRETRRRDAREKTASFDRLI